MTFFGLKLPYAGEGFSAGEGRLFMKNFCDFFCETVAE